jgi:predicted DNA-binding transcriptional regulator YafY
MSQQGTIRRYALIIEKIGNKQFPSFQMIKDYLFDHGFEISDRTLQRDIEQIRTEFGVEILYARGANGYYIDHEMSLNADAFLRFLEIVTTAELLVDSIRDSKESLSYISFESQGNLKGIENLKPLLFAIKNQREIRFRHESFQTGEINEYIVSPYLLKEYQNRWYILGTIGGGLELRTFGIDRIVDLEVQDSIFVPDSDLKPKQLFNHLIGLTYSLDKPQEIILSFTQLQGKYIKSLPLHGSQIVLYDTEEELRVSLFLIPNYEFRQQILKLGDTVQVIQPEKLRDEIKNILVRSLKNYDAPAELNLKESNNLKK